jgi:manganese efflux pump family protein
VIQSPLIFKLLHGYFYGFGAFNWVGDGLLCGITWHRFIALAVHPVHHRLSGMTLLGWLAGATLVHLIAGFDHWLAFGLLAWVGGKMLKSAVTPSAEMPATGCEDPTRGRSLVMLSVATRIDAASVGLSLAFVNVGIIFSSLLIGLTSLALSALGMLIGDRLSRRFGRNMEALGGVILIAIGLRILISHLIS